jgi:hypothetical protein
MPYWVVCLGVKVCPVIGLPGWYGFGCIKHRGVGEFCERCFFWVLGTALGIL